MMNNSLLLDEYQENFRCVIDLYGPIPTVFSRVYPDEGLWEDEGYNWNYPLFSSQDWPNKNFKDGWLSEWKYSPDSGELMVRVNPELLSYQGKKSCFLSILDMKPYVRINHGYMTFENSPSHKFEVNTSEEGRISYDFWMEPTVARALAELGMLACPNFKRTAFFTAVNGDGTSIASEKDQYTLSWAWSGVRDGRFFSIPKCPVCNKRLPVKDENFVFCPDKCTFAKLSDMDPLDIWEEHCKLVSTPIKVKEGKRRMVIHAKLERSAKLSKAKKDSAASLCCEVCGFDFQKTYGDLGSGYIECHHKTPLHSLGDEVRETSLEELALVCSNCHRMLHRKMKQVLPVDKLREIVREAVAV